jgi:hypothetical protein
MKKALLTKVMGIALAVALIFAMIPMGVSAYECDDCICCVEQNYDESINGSPIKPPHLPDQPWF